MLNKEKLESLCLLRGWRFPYTDLARATAHSRSYVRRLILGDEKLTEAFMLKYIKVSGANPDNPTEWASLFDVDVSKDADLSDKKWNFPKLRGQVPYVGFSTSIGMRLGDKPDLEKESTEDWFKRQTIKNNRR